MMSRGGAAARSAVSFANGISRVIYCDAKLRNEGRQIQATKAAPRRLEDPTPFGECYDGDARDLPCGPEGFLDKPRMVLEIHNWDPRAHSRALFEERCWQKCVVPIEDDNGAFDRTRWRVGIRKRAA